MARSTPLAGRLVSVREIGPYRLLRVLGRGGMGTVFLAHHRRLQRQVALKVVEMGSGTNPELLERFRREGRLAARLDHPGIARVYEVGEQEPFAYLAMEYVPGLTLSRMIGPEGFAPEVAAHLVQRIAVALDYAHRAGVIHRDLKPSNVIVDALGRPHVTDFGLARDVEGGKELLTLTNTGRIMGTPAYMSPEQARGDRDQVGPASDVYQVGALFYHLLTGRAPFEGDTPVQILYQVLHRAAVPPRRLRPSVPRDLERICSTAMHPDPRGRYRTALELAQDIERHFRGHEVRAQGSQLASRLARAVRSHPVRAFAFAISFALLVLAIGRHVAGSMAWGGGSARIAEVRVEESRRFLEAGDAVAALESALRAREVSLDSDAARSAEDQARRALAERARVLHREGLARLEEGRWAAALALFERVRWIERLAGGGAPDPAATLERREPTWSAGPVEGPAGFVHPAEDGRRVHFLAGGTRLFVAEPGAAPRPVLEAGGALTAAAALPEGGIVLVGLDRLLRPFHPANDTAERARRVSFARPEALAAAAGRTLAVAGGRELSVLDEDGETRARATAPSGGRILALAWQREAVWLFATDAHGTLLVHDGELRRVHAEPAHLDRAGALDVDPAGRWVATGGWDRKVSVRRIGAWKEAPVATLEPGFRVDAVHFSPRGDRLAVAGWGGAVLVYDTSTWTVRQVLAGSEWGTVSLGFGLSDRWLAGGATDGSVRVWDLGE